MKERIGNNIIKLRLQKGLSQKELAWKLMRNESVIRSWEQGVNIPNTVSVVAIAKVFGITLDALVLKEIK